MVVLPEAEEYQKHFSLEECYTVSIFGDFQDLTRQSYEQPGPSLLKQELGAETS